jgi:predicted restriction endonuclease
MIELRERTTTSIARRQGQPKFRGDLLKAYRGQCAITGFNAEQALEAAHIYPYKGNDTNKVWNGLLLRADIIHFSIFI